MLQLLRKTTEDMMQHIDREFHIAGTADNSIDAYSWTQRLFYHCVYVASFVWVFFVGPAPFAVVSLSFFTAIRISGRGTCVSLWLFGCFVLF